MSIDFYVTALDENCRLEQVLPALDEFITMGKVDYLSALISKVAKSRLELKGGIEKQIFLNYLQESQRFLLGVVEAEVEDEYSGETIRDTLEIRKYKARKSLHPLLLNYLCAVERDGIWAVSMSRGVTAETLRGGSKWIDETFSMSNEVLWDSPRLQPELGTDAWIIPLEQVNTFRQEVNKVMTAKPEFKELDLAYLTEILNLAATSSAFSLVVRTQ